MAKLSPALDRIPPQSLDAEQSVLGCLMIGAGEGDAELRHRLAVSRSALSPDDFYRDSHRHIFRAIHTVAETGASPDVLMVANELERLGALDSAGGRAYLLACIDTVSHVTSMPRHMALVQNAAVLRRLIDTGGRVIGMAYEQEHPVERIIEDAEALVAETAQRWRENSESGKLWTFTAAELAAREVGPPVWIVEGILRDGLTLLGGRSKIGKSWLVYQVAISVATGGRALSSIPVEQRDVLYLALEDDDRRLKSRLMSLLDGSPAPDRLHLATHCPTLSEGALSRIISFLDQHPDCGLVIIDTLARVRGKPDGRGQMYYEDSDFMQRLQRLALDRRIGVLMVHHLNKGQHDDVFDSLSGSTGMQGPTDGMLVLTRVRNEPTARIDRVGRGFDKESPLRIEWADRVGWVLKGELDVIERSEAEIAVLEALVERGSAATPTALAQQMKRNPKTLGKHMQRMEQRGLLQSLQGWYQPTAAGLGALAASRENAATAENAASLPPETAGRQWEAGEAAEELGGRVDTFTEPDPF